MAHKMHRCAACPCYIRESLRSKNALPFLAYAPGQVKQVLPCRLERRPSGKGTGWLAQWKRFRYCQERERRRPTLWLALLPKGERRQKRVEVPLGFGCAISPGPGPNGRAATRGANYLSDFSSHSLPLPRLEGSMIPGRVVCDFTWRGGRVFAGLRMQVRWVFSSRVQGSLLLGEPGRAMPRYSFGRGHNTADDCTSRSTVMSRVHVPV